MSDAPHPPPRMVPSAGEGTSRELVTAVTDLELPFDRELDQYRMAAEEVTEQERELRARLDECRDGGIIPGFRRPAASRAQSHLDADPPAPPKKRLIVPTAAISAEALARQRCRDKAYRDDLYRRRYDPNVRPINEYVDKLRSERRGSIPYIAPTYGGVDAQLLTLMQDPGPKTDLANADGSGMICLENVDLSAARQKFFLDEAGIRISQIVSWNAYPWPKPHPQTDSSDREAAESLRGFLMLTPNIQVVILNGTVAKRIWRALKEIDPACVSGISWHPTFHTSERAVNPTQKSSEYIANVHNDLSNKYAAAARQLHSA